MGPTRTCLANGFRTSTYAYVRCPEGSAPGANRIGLARLKDMRARENNFIAFLNDLNWAQERGRPAKHLGT